jgi:hypothetical protein
MLELIWKLQTSPCPRNRPILGCDQFIIHWIKNLSSNYRVSKIETGSEWNKTPNSQPRLLLNFSRVFNFAVGFLFELCSRVLNFEFRMSVLGFRNTNSVFIVRKYRRRNRNSKFKTPTAKYALLRNSQRDFEIASQSSKRFFFTR